MGVNKAGVTQQLEIRQVFDPNNPAHALGLFVYEKTGHWPAGLFPANEVWFKGEDWLEDLRRKVSGRTPPRQVSEYMREFERVRSLVGEAYTLEPLGDGFVMYVPGCRRWLIQPGESAEAIGRTCFLAWAVHELWEKETPC